MSTKPILFNTEMVKAILEGRKTVTRRIIKRDLLLCCDFDTDGTICGCCDKDGDWYEIEDFAPYKIGDILYVRETFTCWRAHRYEANADIKYKAGGEGKRLFFANGNTDSVDRKSFDDFVNKWYSYSGKWHPSIHMPKEAARIWLKVTNVRVERVEDITEEQAHAEGFYRGWQHPDLPNSTPSETARQAFMWVWHKLYGIMKNYVWVIEFERIEKGDI